jgi:hypothetical protein
MTAANMFLVVCFLIPALYVSWKGYKTEAEMCLLIPAAIFYGLVGVTVGILISGLFFPRIWV